MRIGKFSLNLSAEVMVKVSKEVLTLFDVIVTDDAPDFAELAVSHAIGEGNVPRVETTLSLTDLAGRTTTDTCVTYGESDEPASAALHRVVKLNFYRLLRRRLGLSATPWGILYGIRPVKIVHRWLDQGLPLAVIGERLKERYAVSEEKTDLLRVVALHQRPFLFPTSAKDVSIYIGIPFCLSRCLYCSFPSHLLPGEDELRVFLRTLEKEIASVRAALDRYGLRVQNIYVGGGTPTSLPDSFFAEMMGLVEDAFYHSEVREFTVEAGRPDSLSLHKIQTMSAAHVNRVSVNPQTMQDRTLRRIGRRHTPEDIVTMYGAIRAAGIPSVNMDVILGLPGETAADVRDTMEKITALSPDDVTLHTLALKRGSELKLHLAETELPSGAAVREMFAIAVDIVTKEGFAPYYLYRQGYQGGQLENIGYCRPGRESLYNMQIMEERQTVLGIGGAATSKVVDPKTGRMYASFNAKDVKSYLTGIDTYIEKRSALLEKAYGGLREEMLC
ncbi:MAG: coproporphyrinogen dehydrogenase HemZ [Schwartzia sp. (in: firmicutes)]